MLLDPKKMVVDESRSNPMVVAVTYPDCPLKDADGKVPVCVYMAVGSGAPMKPCKHIKMDEEKTEVSCLYEKVNYTSRKME